MTGPEHYRAAELWIESAAAIEESDPAESSRHLQRAQVHATLANAAATMELAFAHRVAHDMGRTPSTENWAVALAPTQ
jgi:hypothetical protein